MSVGPTTRRHRSWREPDPLASVVQPRRGVSRTAWLTRLSWAAGAWALLYGLYRAYYALGGTFAMIGVPASDAAWRAVNLVGAAIILVVAALPIVALRWSLWERHAWRSVMLSIAWVIAVGAVTHALVSDVTRIASLAGLYEVRYPEAFWISVDTRAADLQDLLFNETWFLGEGILWAAIGWVVLGAQPMRRWWAGSAVLAIASFTMIGLLSAFGVVGRIVVG